MASTKTRVLVVVDWFEPGFKAGGPIRSCVNFVSLLQNDLEIFVFTSDRDLGDEHPYSGIKPDTWQQYNGNAQVFYASPGWLSWKGLKKIIEQVQPEVIYLNSMYSKYFALYPLLLRRNGFYKGRIVLAPRGMLRQSAVQFKSRKKKIFLRLFRMLSLQRFIHFHCTDATEAADVKKYFGDVQCTVLSNAPGKLQELQLPLQKEKGALDILIVGRIHPIKNIAFFLDVLKSAQQRIWVTIIGSEEDNEYFEKCSDIIDRLPPDVNIDFRGELPHHEIERILLQHHLFVLPTRGENFGHAIFEALAAGRPVLISDQTPWRGLSDNKAGWDLPLNSPEKFLEVVQNFASMSHDELNEWCTGAWRYAKDFLERSEIKEQYIKLFS